MTHYTADAQWQPDLLRLVALTSADVKSGPHAAQIANPILDAVRFRFGCCLVQLWSVDPRREQLVLMAESCDSPIEKSTVGVIQVGDTLTGRAVETRQLQIHNKPSEGPVPRFWTTPLAKQLGIRSFVSVPVRNIGNPHQITLVVNVYFDYHLEHVFTHIVHRDVLQLSTRLLATAFESNLRERSIRMSARVSLALARVEHLTAESGSAAFAKCAREALGTDWVTVYLEDWNKTLKTQAHDRSTDCPLTVEDSVAAEINRVYTTNREFLSPFTASESSDVELVKSKDVKIESAMLVPLHDLKGRCKGVLRSVNIARSDPTWRRAHSYDDIAVVEAMERSFASPLEMLLESQARDISLQSLGHELRVPVVALRAVHEQMKEEYDDARLWFQFRYPYFTETETFTGVMQRLLKNLEITRLGPGKVPMTRQWSKLLGDIIQPAIRFMQPILREHGMTTQQITHHGFEFPPPIEVDRALLTQVVFNLLDNAVKYFPKMRHRTEFRGTVVCNAYPGKVEIVFRDNGGGIPDDMKERIFDFGFRCANAMLSNVMGTGLGCWLARELALRHNGSLTVRACSPLELVLELPHPRNRFTNVPTVKD